MHGKNANQGIHHLKIINILIVTLHQRRADHKGQKQGRNGKNTYYYPEL